VDAEPLFHQLYQNFKGAVDFVAVIDTAAAKARRWASEKQTPYPIVPDEDKKIIKAFAAKSSAYSVVAKRYEFVFVERNGH
jgi:peroxiredoxin